MTLRLRRGLLAFGTLLMFAGCSCDDPPMGDGGLPDGGMLLDAPVTVECGDGALTGTEECDDGNQVAGDGCSATCILECGDGVVSGAEACDTGISSGQEGACPEACDDGDSCTVDALMGEACMARCEATEITDPADGDECCPSGGDLTNDSDCLALCGDGEVHPQEACDTAIAAGMPGACPSACDDGMDCTSDALVGATCLAICEFTAITDPADGDLCCPNGANPGNDSDCDAECGDGVVSGSEVCDTSIAAGMPGACPSACDDGQVCTTDVLQNGGTCAAFCGSTLIEDPIDGDGCCPAGATAGTDNDCTDMCGNGTVESGEACDTAISGGMAGECPTACDDSIACTEDNLSGAGTCAATCSHPPITAAVNGDMCCPSGVTIADDDDCPTVCGDGVVTGTEACDTAIAAGSAGACPTACDDGDVCTDDTLTNPGTCRAACPFTPHPVGAADLCCPSGADPTTDPDCVAMCGDGVRHSPETCDDGGTAPGDECGADCQVEGFRFTSLVLRDPQIYASVVIFCNESTGFVNNLIADNISGDEDGGGFLDLSAIQAFAPVNRTPGESSPAYVGFPGCTAPESSTQCFLPSGATTTAFPAMNQSSGTCLQPLSGTTTTLPAPNMYAPITEPTAGGSTVCYSGASTMPIVLDLAGITITLYDAQIGGEWSGNDDIEDGLLFGFITEADANAAIVPSTVPLVGGEPLSSLLPGGIDSCAMHSDLDIHPTRGPGWYMYLNFEASRVPYFDER